MLSGVTLVLRSALERNGSLSIRDNVLLNNIPGDIRTARKELELQPDTTIYAACPKCSTLYKPDYDSGGIPLYPSTCTALEFGTAKSCGADLTQKQVRKGESVRMPLKPYAVQDLDAFVARMLNEPGMEALLESYKRYREKEELYDISDGTRMRELEGPDGSPFLTGGVGNELRLMWILSVDWFNPLFNKAAGRAMSAGSIAFSCANLPLSMRNKPEYIYLAAIIPGPHEPKKEASDRFMEPIVSQFLHSYKNGTRYSRTADELHGRLVRNAILALVADLPGAKKIGGLASHSADMFCSFCDLKKEDLNRNIDPRTWRRRTFDQHKQRAIEWRDAPNNAQRKTLYRKHGIRWSELMNLPYWDPTRCIVVDVMHNLFLGVVAFHIREILGVDWSEGAIKKRKERNQISQSKPITKACRRFLRAAWNFMEQGDVKRMARRCTKEVLQEVCKICDVIVPPVGGKDPTKAQIAAALIVRFPP